MNKKKNSTQATRWSSDFVIAEFRYMKAKVISLDCTNNFLFLPSKTQIGIKNLNLPIDEITTIPRLTKIEPGPASWNPHVSNQNLCCLASHTRVDLFSIKNYAELNVDSVLKSHTRVITGVSWHPIDPNVIATCSLDTFTHIWDIREPQKPAVSLSSFAAVGHVKWNKLSRHLLATVHGGDVKIWDERKSSSPVQYISAHLTSIHCLDWCHFKENQISTASQDGTVKFFDINNPRKTEFVINADAPVWRAGYTPFGRGLLVVTIPSARKTENNLLLWNLPNNKNPLNTFVGHTEIVLDFQWRYFPQDGSEYQLITWSKDQTLRIWEIDKYLQELCGARKAELDSDVVDCAPSLVPEEIASSQESVSTTKRFELKLAEREIGSTSSSNNSETSEGPFRNPMQENGTEVMSSSSDSNSVTNKSSTVTTITPMNLQQEFSVSINILNVQILKTDIIRRMCCATAKCNGQIVVLWINFPPSYPRNKGPIFRFAPGTTVSNEVRCKLLEALRDTADFKVKNNQACLEACLRTLIVTAQQLTQGDNEKVSSFNGDGPVAERISSFGINQDAYCVPARTCGAKFSFVDKLICFAKPVSQFQASDKNICGLVNLSNRQTEALSRLYLQNKNGSLPPRTKYMIRRGLLKRMKNARQNKRVFVYDVSSLFLLNKELAMKYKLSGPDLKTICTHNAQVASSVGRRDLQQIWNLVLISAMTISNTYNVGIEWEAHPLAKEMLQSIISFYISQSDIQTAATLCCVFQQHLFKSDVCHMKPRSSKSISNTTNPCTHREWLSEPSGSPYHAVYPVDTSALEIAWSFPMRKHTRSSSWSEFLEDFRSSNMIEPAEAMETTDTFASAMRTLKDDNIELLFDHVIRAYADILHRWQLLTVRGMIMKSVRIGGVEMDKGMRTVAECQQCKNSVAGILCSVCKVPTLYCVICRVSVRGLASVCIRCGHGGHLLHMMKWYETETRCPMGCMCQCFMSFTKTQ